MVKVILAITDQRLVPADIAAGIVGCQSATTFEQEVADGVWPRAMPFSKICGKKKRKVWDVVALHKRMDEHSGISYPDECDVDLDEELGL